MYLVCTETTESVANIYHHKLPATRVVNHVVSSVPLCSAAGDLKRAGCSSCDRSEFLSFLKNEKYIFLSIARCFCFDFFSPFFTSSLPSVYPNSLAVQFTLFWAREGKLFFDFRRRILLSRSNTFFLSLSPPFFKIKKEKGTLCFTRGRR